MESMAEIRSKSKSIRSHLKVVRMHQRVVSAHHRRDLDNAEANSIKITFWSVVHLTVMMISTTLQVI